MFVYYVCVGLCSLQSAFQKNTNSNFLKCKMSHKWISKSTCNPPYPPINKSSSPSLQLPSYDQGSLLEAALNYCANRGGCILASRQHVYTWMDLQINSTINLTNRQWERARTPAHAEPLTHKHLSVHSHDYSVWMHRLMRIYIIFNVSKQTAALNMIL